MDRDTTALKDNNVRSADLFFDSAPGLFLTLRLDREEGYSIPFLRGNRNLFPSLSPESVATTIEPLLHLCHPEDRDPLLHELNASARENRLCRAELRTEDRNDRSVVIELTAHPKLDPDDAGVVEWHGVMQDITERKQIEEQLRMKEHALECSSDAVFLSNDQGRFVYANERACRSLGYTLEELHTMDITDIDPGFTMPEVWNLPEKIGSHGSCTVEALHRRKGGETYPVELRISEMEYRGQKMGLAMARDITERKRMEIELATREREFRSLAENSPDAIFRYDRECRRIYVNRTVERVSGKSREELLGRSPTEYIPLPSLDAMEVEQCIRTVFENATSCEHMMKLYGKDGEERIIHNVFVPELSSDGSVETVLCIGRDITDRKHMEEKLQERQAFLHSLLEAIPVPVFYKDREGRYLGFNRAYEEFFGAKKKDLLGKSVFDISPEDLAKVYHAKDSELFAQGGIQRYESRVKSASGDFRDVIFHKAVFEDFAKGERGGLIGVILDITDRKRTELDLQNQFTEIVRLNDELEDLARSLEEQTVELEASQESLKQTEAWYRGILHSAPDGMMVISRNGAITQVNVELLRMFGYSEEELIGQRMELLVPPAMREIHVSHRERFADRTDAGSTARLVSDLRACRKGGSEFFVDVTLSVLPETEWNSGSICASIRDVTERRNAEELLATREHEFRTLVENTTDTVARYGKDLRRLYANPAFTSMVEGGSGALLGKRPSEVPGGPFARFYEEKLMEVLESGEVCDFELPWQDKTGKEIYSLISMTPEFNPEGRISSVLAVGRDISELYAIRKEIHRMAFFDPLTDLPNRSLFNDRIHQILADASYHHQMAGLMMIDMDRFKVVNDTMGHAIGDELLRETGARLSGCVRTYDTVARLGGDEFAVILPDIRHADDLARIANKMRSVFDAPFFLNGKEVFVSCSIGIALFPDDSTDPDDLLKFADSAMYVAKRTGRNTFRFYSKEMTEVANERLMLESELRRAIARDELALMYQPKFDLASRQTTGSEALLRWNHPGRGMISPEKFIPIAEDSGLILELGEWVLREACRTASNLNSPGRPLHKVAINLSARQFQTSDLVGAVALILKETECRPQWIELEITESLLLDEGSGAIDVLIAFRSMGITIAIDDFGTGYSSLSYLARFPINTLKIDRSFVFSLENDPSRAELVKAILSFARSMGQEVVAEGVETRGQADFLLAHGCHIAQGFWFSRPVSKAHLIALVDSAPDL